MTRYLSHNLKLGPATPSALRRRVRRVRLDRRARAPTRVPHHRRAHRGVAPQGWFPLYFLSFRLSLSFSYFFFIPLRRFQSLIFGRDLPRARVGPSRRGEDQWGGSEGWGRPPPPPPGRAAMLALGSQQAAVAPFFSPVRTPSPPHTHTQTHDFMRGGTNTAPKIGILRVNLLHESNR